MPAKWQTWMPRQIDAWHGSTFVQFSDPAARSGYADLLDKQWQSEDCTVPDDQQELSELSGLGPQLWEIHGPRILKKFVLIEPGKRRNQVGYLLWMEAKRVYESRQKAALETNLKRTQKAEAARLRRAERTVTVTPSPHSNKDIVEEQQQKPHPHPPLTARGPGSPRAAGSVDDQALPAVQATGSPAQTKENKERNAQISLRTERQTSSEGIHPEKSGNGAAVPPQFVTPGVKNGVYPSKTDATAIQMKWEVLAYWRGQNPDSPAYQWCDPDHRALQALRTSFPDLSVELFKRLLQARAASGVAPLALPHKWLRRLMEYKDGPLDRYKQPLRDVRQL
jgi:hypothetical protein